MQLDEHRSREPTGSRREKPVWHSKAVGPHTNTFPASTISLPRPWRKHSASLAPTSALGEHSRCPVAYQDHRPFSFPPHPALLMTGRAPASKAEGEFIPFQEARLIINQAALARSGQPTLHTRVGSPHSQKGGKREPGSQRTGDPDRS